MSDVTTQASPLYLEDIDKERIFSVFNYTDNESLLNGKGYIFEGGDIFIFTEAEKKPQKIPYMWFDEDKNLTFSDVTEEVKKHYNKGNLTDYSYDSICKNTVPGEALYDEKEIADMNDASSIFVPVIDPDDDFLKVMVKMAILKKGININRLKSKFDAKYTLANKKSPLTSSTRMSVTNFRIWMEVLGCDFQIMISDSGDDMNTPLDKPVLYDSKTNNTIAVDIDSYEEFMKQADTMSSGSAMVTIRDDK